MGTPEFAVGVLRALVESEHNVVGVVTTADKPAGRGRQLRCSAVKDYVLSLDSPTVSENLGEGSESTERSAIKLLQPDKLRDEGFISELRSLEADLFIVVAFRMLPEIVWAMPQMGTFNLHASLLPDYRGAAPINWAIMNGDKRTGVSTFMLNHEIDCGGILAQKECDILASDNVEDLYNRLMTLGEGLVLETVAGLASGELSPKTQREDISMRPAPKLFKETMQLVYDTETIIETLHNKIRGLSPYPAAWANISVEGKNEITAKIFLTHIERGEVKAEQQGVWQCDGSTYLRLALKDGWLYIDEMQPQNKKRVKTVDFLRGWR